MELDAEAINRSLAHGESFAHGFMSDRRRKYDPVKRREYYLKTRQLKGRKVAADVRSADKNRTNRNTYGSYQQIVKGLTDRLKDLRRQGKADGPEYEKIRLTLADVANAYSDATQTVTKNPDGSTTYSSSFDYAKLMADVEKVSNTKPAKDIVVDYLKDSSDRLQNLVDPNGKGKKQYKRTSKNLDRAAVPNYYR